MARPKTTNREIKITVHPNMGAIYDRLVSLGMHGRNVAEVVATLAAREAERLVVHEKIFTQDLLPPSDGSSSRSKT